MFLSDKDLIVHVKLQGSFSGQAYSLFLWVTNCQKSHTNE